MKKISLKNLNFNEIEQLSREQLRNVIGGTDDHVTHPGGDQPCNSDCTGSCKNGGIDGRCLPTSSGGCRCGTSTIPPH